MKYDLSQVPRRLSDPTLYARTLYSRATDKFVVQVHSLNFAHTVARVPTIAEATAVEEEVESILRAARTMANTTRFSDYVRELPPWAPRRY